MEQLRSSGFVGADTLEFEAYAGHILLEGEIACLGEIVVSVWKHLSILDDNDDPYVQTERYAYNAFVRGHGTFLRVDNSHAHHGHADAHHRHFGDWRTDDDLPGSPEWIGAERWPTLGAFIEEDVWKWYDAHREELPAPESFARIGLR